MFFLWFVILCFSSVGFRIRVVNIHRFFEYCEKLEHNSMAIEHVQVATTLKF